MERWDVAVVGGGVSGLAFAWAAARAGRSVLVLERQLRAGGCIRTERTEEGFWFEMGAHTLGSSYVQLLDLAENAGVLPRIRRRARVPVRLLVGDALVSPFRALHLAEALRALPAALAAPRGSDTVASRFSRIVGARNYREVVGPLLSAIPCQDADWFPAAGPGALLRRRRRRPGLPRRFTLDGGLSTLVEALGAGPGIELATGAEVIAVARGGGRFVVITAGGREISSDVLAIAAPPPAAAALLGRTFPEVAERVGRIRCARVETLGFAVPARAARAPASAFIVPVRDVFRSVVTRDVIPDPRFRGFAVHFGPGIAPEAKRARASEILGVSFRDAAPVVERDVVLPSLVVGHAAEVAAIDALLRGSRLALTGNYFGGLALEDCVARSRAEWTRLAMHT